MELEGGTSSPEGKRMLNKAPIFVNGFKYGGTNLIMNLLASHPDVCLLSGETQCVFNSSGGRHRLDKWSRRLFYRPIKLSSGKKVFHNTKDIDTPRRLAPFMKPYVDLFFFIDKITADKNEYKSENVRYSREEVRKSRFLAKNVNGLVLASDLFSEMYPDATFIALVRNGLALCEGFMRRGWTAAESGRMYETVCRKMIEDSRKIPNYHLVRFEDMVRDPLGFMKKIYSFAGLDEGRVAKVRLQAKRSMNKDGTRSYTFGGSKDRETHWFPVEEIRNYFRGDVNKNQIEQLGAGDREIFLQQAGSSMEKLGYL
jgi:hypothetical protein